MKERRSTQSTTIPSTVAEELSFNPFMRVREASILEATGQSDPVQAMDTLRNQKNAFK